LASGITAALVKGKPNVMKAADELIVSPEFQALAKSGDVDKFIGSSKFRRFWNAVGGEERLGDPGQWVLSSLQATRQQAPEVEDAAQ
jgi:hypothetical protein